MRKYFIAALALLVSAASANAGRKDIIDRSFITPTRIIWTSGEVDDAEALLVEGTGQSSMTGGRMCRMSTQPSDTASIILDYGKELHGGIKLVMAGRERYPKLVRIRFGESVSETCSEVCDTDWIPGHSTDDHAMRDIVMKIPRDGSIELGNTGFRFVRIDLLEPGCTLEIREATAILRWRDIPYQGSFRCSDSRLDTIWSTGAWTTHLNMQEYIWDGIKRDRLIWLGDMHPEMATVATVFGWNDVIDRSIDLACEQFPLPDWHNGMSSYSMWYLVILHDWYMQNGNLDYIKKHRDYITGLIDIFDSMIGGDGSINIEGRIFLDWPSSPNQEGVMAGYRALLCLALEDASKLCECMGDKTHADLSLEIRGRLLKAVEPHNNLKQSAAIMAIAGLMPAEQACEEVVSVGGAEGFSTFYGYYMLEALAMAGRYQEAIDIIRQFWGGMIDLGATTFWEDFNLEWAENAGRIDEMPQEGKTDIHRDFGAFCYLSYRHSLCHGWASGPTPWLSHHVLGVKVVEAGCKKVCIDPHLGDLEWAEGTYPTPYGNISVRVDKDNRGRTVARVSKPRKVRIEAGEGIVLKKMRRNQNKIAMEKQVSGHIVDVLAKEIYDGTITVRDGKISGIRKEKLAEGAPYIMPGFVDSHVHIESTLLTPENFAALAVTKGVVSVVSDPHEIANVTGLEGVDFMIDNGRKVHFHFNFGASPCVPCTGFETAGATLDSKDIAALLERDDIYGLAEFMNAFGLVSNDPECVAKIEAAKRLGKPVDGHAPGISGEMLRKYIEAGVSTDHECTTLEECRERLALGMSILIREGSAACDYDNLSPLLAEWPDHIMFCSDDKYPDELAEGYIDALVRISLSKGYPLWNVLNAACATPIAHYGLKHGMLREGDSADFITVDGLDTFNVLSTWIDGVEVFADGKVNMDHLVTDCTPTSVFPNNFHACRITAEDLRTEPEGDLLKVITATDKSLRTGVMTTAPLVVDGNVVSDTEKDVLKMLVYNRYTQSKPQVAFIHGFSLKRGAMASTIAHDSHNIIAIGTSDDELVSAVNRLVELKGGMVITDGDKVCEMPLPVAGLMSDLDGTTAAGQYRELKAQAVAQGCPFKAPFMTMSFMALPVIPSLKLTDKGLFDADKFEFTGIFHPQPQA